MDKQSAVAVWLHDHWARVMVGAPPSKTASRWAAQGTIVEERGPGFWFKGQTIEEASSDPW